MSLLFSEADASHCLINTALPVAFPFAIGGWTYLTTLGGNPQTLFSLGNNVSEDNYFQIAALTDGRIRMRTRATTDVDVTSAATFSVNTWHHVFAVWNAVDDHQLYVDYADFATDATTQDPTGINNAMLARLAKQTPLENLTGRLAEWAYYTGTMPTTPEIEQLANMISPLDVNIANLAHHWRVLGEFDPVDVMGGVDFVRVNTPVNAPHVDITGPNPPSIPGWFGVIKLEGFTPLEGRAYTAMANGLSNEINLTGFAPLEGRAFTTGLLDVFRNASNPPLSGDKVDIGNSSVFQLKVDGGLVDLSATCQFNVEELLISYEGKELRFSEITGIGSPTYNPEQEVTLDIDFTGSGSPANLQRIFTGRIRTRGHQGVNNNEAVNYTAIGNMGIANTTLLNTTGKPDVGFTVGTTVTSITSAGIEVTTTFAKRLSEAVQDIFTLHAAALNTLGIPSTIGAPGLNAFTIDLPETIEFQNSGFVNALTQLAQFQSGVKPYYDDKDGVWKFFDLFNATTAVIDISSVNMLELPYDISTDDRFTAVRLFSNTEDALDDAIINKSNSIVLNGNPGSILRTELTLTPFWITSLQVDWTLLKALAPNPFTLEDQNFFVYKRWKLPENAPLPFPGGPFMAFQKTNYFGEVKWSKLHGRTIFTRRTFTARFHAFGRGNPFIPGDVIGPLEVRLAYYPLALPVTLQTSVTSDGTPVLINTVVDTSQFLDEIRRPPSGFTGTAFDDFGIERELVRVVDRTEITTVNADALLNVHKDTIISGELPIDGDPIEEIIHLGVRIRVQDATRITGIQSTSAQLTSYRYQFGKRGTSSIGLTTDISGLTRTI